MNTLAQVPVVVLGGTGYVAGEVLRLLASHPHLHLATALSRSRASEPIAATFPHLAPAYPTQTFSASDALEGLLAANARVALFSCLPHGEAARQIDAALLAASHAGCDLQVVDLSADFRIPDRVQWEEVYGQPHGAPERLPEFTSALPDLAKDTLKGPVAHPGCFTTCVTLACAPLHALGLAEPTYRVTAITGSTGSGRSPSAGTHHPDRMGNLMAYKPLVHRHRVEMEGLLGALNRERPRVLFVPHSGPFARGIHATVHVRLHEPTTGEDLRAKMARFYEDTPFVRVQADPPRLKAVTGTNHALLSAACDGQDAVVFGVIDNLVKGAAGGGIQWMNRLLGLEASAGLKLPGQGWG